MDYTNLKIGLIRIFLRSSGHLHWTPMAPKSLETRFSFTRICWYGSSNFISSFRNSTSFEAKGWHEADFIGGRTLLTFCRSRVNLSLSRCMCLGLYRLTGEVLSWMKIFRSMESTLYFKGDANLRKFSDLQQNPTKSQNLDIFPEKPLWTALKKQIWIFSLSRLLKNRQFYTLKLAKTNVTRVILKV